MQGRPHEAVEILANLGHAAAVLRTGIELAAITCRLLHLLGNSSKGLEDRLQDLRADPQFVEQAAGMTAANYEPSPRLATPSLGLPLADGCSKVAAIPLQQARYGL